MYTTLTGAAALEHRNDLIRSASRQAASSRTARPAVSGAAVYSVLRARFANRRHVAITRPAVVGACFGACA